MGRYQISTNNGDQVEVTGGNWLVALGLGLDSLGVVANIDRLACEVLLGGTVIVRDVRAGKRFVVQCMPEDEEPLVEIEDPEADTELLAATAADEELFLGETDSDEDDSEAALDEDSDEDAPPDMADISAALMPLSANEEELLLFNSPLSSRRGEHVQVVTDRPDSIITLPIEALLMPEDSTETIDASLQAISAQIDASQSAFDAWCTALEGARRLVDAESGAALAREEDGALRFLFAVGPRAQEVLGRRLPPGRGIAGFCTQRSVRLLITEPHRDPRFFSRMDQTTGYTTTSVLAVPVSTDDEMLGCLELLNAPTDFRQEQLQWLDVLAVRLAERLIAAPV